MVLKIGKERKNKKKLLNIYKDLYKAFLLDGKL